MPRKCNKRLTPVETVIMDRLWDFGEASVRQVRESLRPVKPMAYNTVLTVMRILRDKGFLKSERDGRMDVYRPLVTRDQMARRSLGEVLDRFFAGSAAALVSRLLDSDELSVEEIEAIRSEVDEALKGDTSRRGSST